VFPLRVPPLRERAEDLPLLCERFLAGLRRPVARRMSRVTPEAVGAMAAYPWPGNVRELQNALEYAALQAGEEDIGPGHLPAEIRAAAGSGRRAGRRARGPPPTRSGSGWSRSWSAAAGTAPAPPARWASRG